MLWPDDKNLINLILLHILLSDVILIMLLFSKLMVRLLNLSSLQVPFNHCSVISSNSCLYHECTNKSHSKSLAFKNHVKHVYSILLSLHKQSISQMDTVLISKSITADYLKFYH